MCILWTVSSYITWQIIPLYVTRKQATDLQTKLGASADWYTTSRKRTGRKRSLLFGTVFPNLFHTLQKVSGLAKVCALCIEKRKKLYPEGVNRQHKNVISVTFHCAVWGVFWNTTSSEMWRCKIRQVGYYMHNFITNKMKKELSFCLF